MGGVSRGGCAAESSGGELVKGGGQIGLEVEILLQSHQLDGLHDPGVANHKKLDVVLIAILRQLHESAQARGIDEIDLAQIDHQRELVTSPLFLYELGELLV